MIAANFTNRTALSSLQKRWILFALVSAAVLLGGYYFLSRNWSATYALRWAVFTAAILLYQAWLLWNNLKENHRLGEELLLPGLGLGNSFTLLRGVMFAALTGFLFSPRPQGMLVWIPAGLYTAGALMDYLDGFTARATNQVTKLGEILDMSLDGWGVLVASTLAVQYAQAPAWYLLVGWARYLFLVGLWLRARLHWPIYELTPNVRRRSFAGLQMGFGFVILWPVFTPPGTYHAAAIFSLPFLAGFLWDWLLVSGTISAGMGKLQHNVKEFALRWLPLGPRAAVVLLVAPALAARWSGFEFQEVASGGFGTIGSKAWALTLAGLETLVAAGILAGAGGRIMAIAGLVVLGIHQIAAPLNGNQIVLVWIYGAVLYAGTGAFSAWKPEEHLIRQRAGE